VLKLTDRKNVSKDGKIYARVGKTLRNRYLAKVYWRTKYVILQKYGTAARIPSSELVRLKLFAKKYGLSDVRPDNIRKVDGMFKIVDAWI